MKVDPFKNGNERDRATETWLLKCTTMPNILCKLKRIYRQHENNRKTYKIFIQGCSSS